MADPPPRPADDAAAANVAAAFRLLDGETGDGAERIVTGIRRMLSGPQGAASLKALVSAWDSPDPAVRRQARRFSCEALLGEAEGRPGVPPPDPFAERRYRMVRDQLYRQGILDPRVLRAMLEVPREAFLPEAQHGRAYDPQPLPIGEDQTISQPFIVAYMTEALGLRGTEKVLEVGTGSGYQAAVLARTAREVYSVEVRETLSRRAAEALARGGHANVRLRTGDGHAGWPEAAPFDAVVVTCAPDDVPPALVAQLGGGGRLVAPVGPLPDDQQLVRLTRDGGGVRRETLIAVRFVPMIEGGTGRAG
jgi:protein-L-isoaspartate(D-aspartate) O-methyltransferase